MKNDNNQIENSDINLNEHLESSAKIDWYENVYGIRMRPAMYIGDIEIDGLHHLVKELIDNAVDEITNGYASECKVVIWEDGSCSVEDNGRGIPVYFDEKAKVSALQLVFTKLHAGGKFNNNNYKYSGGLHGVGATAVNALSKWLEVTVWKNKPTTNEKAGEYFMKFMTYRDSENALKVGEVFTPLTRVKNSTDKHGSFIHFMPDPEVFGEYKLDFDRIAETLQQKAFLNKGAVFTLEDRRPNNDPDFEPTKTFCYKEGIVEMIRFLNKDEDIISPDILYFNKVEDKKELEIAFQFVDNEEERIFSYCNLIPTPLGGDHVTAFKSVFTSFMNDYARKNKLLKDKEENIPGDYFRSGMVAVITVRMQGLQFTSQTKDKIVSKELGLYVQSAVKSMLDELPFNDKNKKLKTAFDGIVQRAKQLYEEKINSKAAKEAKKKTSSSALLAKFANCIGKKPELNEIFIVEGDSAGGTAKQCRDRFTQAILPLRGKVINSEKCSRQKLLDNEEICTIIAALGAGYGKEFNLDNLKFDKVVILSDADQDGGHIRSLLITFFYNYMRPLITEGHLYIGMPPLYRLQNKTSEQYVFSDKELEEAKVKFGKNATLQRYKGLGEMNKEQLWATTMDPQRRSLIKVVIDDDVSSRNMLKLFMGDNAEERKIYIGKHADFNKVDNFMRKDD